MRLIVILIVAVGVIGKDVFKESEEVKSGEEEEDDDEDTVMTFAEFANKRMKQEFEVGKKKNLPPKVYAIPGPQEPLPGRSHPSDYWPVFPFQNQFSGGLDLDPSTSRHVGGGLEVAIPSWGMLDMYGRWYNRISDTTTKFGYLNHPVNMLDLEREDFVQLMSDASLHHNRAGQPTLPLGKFAKNFVPLSCKPPLCNPYTMTFAFGMEHDYGGHDGVEGDLDVAMPIAKGIAYRYPIGGKVYYDFDNITVTYGQNLAPIDPFQSLFKYQRGERDPNIAIKRRTVHPFEFLGYEPPKKSKRTKRDVFGDNQVLQRNGDYVVPSFDFVERAFSNRNSRFRRFKRRSLDDDQVRRQGFHEKGIQILDLSRGYDSMYNDPGVQLYSNLNPQRTNLLNPQPFELSGFDPFRFQRMTPQGTWNSMYPYQLSQGQ